MTRRPRNQSVGAVVNHAHLRAAAAADHGLPCCPGFREGDPERLESRRVGQHVDRREQHRLQRILEVRHQRYPRLLVRGQIRNRAFERGEVVCATAGDQESRTRLGLPDARHRAQQRPDTLGRRDLSDKSDKRAVGEPETFSGIGLRDRECARVNADADRGDAIGRGPGLDDVVRLEAGVGDVIRAPDRAEDHAAAEAPDVVRVQAAVQDAGTPRLLGAAQRREHVEQRKRRGGDDIGWCLPDRAREPLDDRAPGERAHVLIERHVVLKERILNAAGEPADAGVDRKAADAHAVALLPSGGQPRRVRREERLAVVTVGREDRDLVAELRDELFGHALDQQLGAADRGRVALRDVEDLHRRAPTRRDPSTTSRPPLSLATTRMRAGSGTAVEPAHGTQ